MFDPMQPDYQNTPVAAGRPRLNVPPPDGPVTPVVTIITPFFNTGEEFHQTAQSVLQQSLRDWEWLIVNDGSTDETSLEILNRYRCCDPRIRVIDQENRGLSGARNRGFSEARTGFVFQLDSDDLIEPTTLEKCFWFLISHPEFGFVKGYNVGFGGQEYYWTKGFHQPQDFLAENAANATAMVRKTVHQAVGGYDEARRGGLEDWDFWLKCADQGIWGGTIPEFLDWYRRRQELGDRWENLRDSWREQFVQEAQRRYPALWTNGMPGASAKWHMPYESVSMAVPSINLYPRTGKRILLLMPYLTIGGAEKYALDLVRMLTAHHGYEVSIVTTLPGDHSRMSEYARYTSDIFPLHHFLRAPDFPKFIHYLIKSRQVDVVVVSNSYLGYRLLPALRALCPETAFVDYVHMEEEYWKNGGYPRASLNYSEQLDLTVAASQHLKTWMVERGKREDKIAVCTINVDVDEWNPDLLDRNQIRKSLGIEPSTLVILFSGRLVEQKRPKLLGQIIARLEEHTHDFVCLVAGDGPDRGHLQNLVSAGKISRLQLLGNVSSGRMRQLMAASDVFLLPSKMEGISLAIYEAMAMQLAIVAADVGGQAELVTPDCGTLVPVNDDEVETYVEAVMGFVRQPDQARQFGRAGRTRVAQHFRLQDMGNHMVALFSRAMASARLVPPEKRWMLEPDSIATEAVELSRVEQLADELWARPVPRSPNGRIEKLASLYAQTPTVIRKLVSAGFDTATKVADRVSRSTKGQTALPQVAWYWLQLLVVALTAVAFVSPRLLYLDDYFFRMLAHDIGSDSWKPLFQSPFPLRQLAIVLISNTANAIPTFELSVRVAAAFIHLLNGVAVGYTVSWMTKNRVLGQIAGLMFVCSYFASEAILWHTQAWAHGAGTLVFLFALVVCTKSVEQRSLRRKLGYSGLTIMLVAVGLQFSELPAPLIALMPMAVLFRRWSARNWDNWKSELAASLGLTALTIAVGALHFLLFTGNAPDLQSRGGLNLDPTSIAANYLEYLQRLNWLIVSPNWGGRITLEAFELGVATLGLTIPGLAFGLAVLALVARWLVSLNRLIIEEPLSAKREVGLVFVGVFFALLSLIPGALLGGQELEYRMLYVTAIGVAMTLAGAIGFLLRFAKSWLRVPVYVLMSTTAMAGLCVYVGHATIYAMRGHVDQQQLAWVVNDLPESALPEGPVVFVPVNIPVGISASGDKAYDRLLYGVFEVSWAADGALATAYRRSDIRSVTAHHWAPPQRFALGTNPYEVLINEEAITIDRLVVFTITDSGPVFYSHIELMAPGNRPEVIELPILAGSQVDPARISAEPFSP